MNKYKYNNISVTEKNINTNNHCINVNQLINGKEFNFIIDNESYILTTKQVMNYIAKHPNSYRKKKYSSIDDKTGKTKISYGSFYLIEDNWIINNAA